MENAALALALAASISGSSLDAVLDGLRNRTDPKGQVEAAAELSRRASGLDPVDRSRATSALEQAASDSFSEGQVRGKALEALGRSAGSGDESERRRAINVLLEHAKASGPQDFRAETKVYALRGLIEASGRLPTDDATREAVFNAALDAMRDASRLAERTQGAKLLDSAMRGGAFTVLLNSHAVRSRYETEVVGPLEGGYAQALYADPQGTLEYRYYVMRTLALSSRMLGRDPNLPHRCRALLATMSQNDPEPRLREMARLYSRPGR